MGTSKYPVSAQTFSGSNIHQRSLRGSGEEPQLSTTELGGFGEELTGWLGWELEKRPHEERLKA